MATSQHMVSPLQLGIRSLRRLCNIFESGYVILFAPHTTFRYLLYMPWQSGTITLNKFSTRPFGICRCLLDPLEKLSSLDLGSLVCRLNLHFLAIYKFPLLLLDSNKTFFKFVATKNDGKRRLLPFPSRELRRKFGFILG